MSTINERSDTSMKPAANGAAGIDAAERSTKRRPQGISGLETLAIFLAMAGVHAYMLWFASWHESIPFNDVTTVYRGWLDDAAASGEIPGIHAPLVYPVLAIVPMWLASVIGGEHLYAVGWIVVVFLVNCLPLYLLAAHDANAFNARLRLRAAWWWVIAVALLGPAALGRIDAITIPIVIAALLFARRKVATSGALLTIGAWIKVWPAAAFVALVTAHRHRLRAILAGAVVTALVIVTALLVGGTDAFSNLTSFVSGQTGRGLQVESVAAGWFVWLGSIDVPGYQIFFNSEIITVEITGPGTAAVAGVLTPLMFILMLGFVVTAVWSLRNGGQFARVLPALTLGLVATFIAANKVGSPQFYGWLAAPIVLGMIWDGRRYRLPAIVGWVVVALTQLIYPFMYQFVMSAHDAGALVLGVRNLLLLTLLVVAFRLLLPVRRRRFVPLRASLTAGK